MCSFVVYNIILFVIWTHPQRLRSSNPTLKVPCVPWIPIGSTLFHCIMLFQLPALAWIVSLLWLLTGNVLLHTMLLNYIAKNVLTYFSLFRNGPLFRLRLPQQSSQFQFQITSRSSFQQQRPCQI